MKKPILSILLSILLGGTLAHGAVYTVNVGQTIQTAINSASSGDEIIVNGAFFDEALVINGKSLTIRRQNLVPEIKSLTFTNAGGTSRLEGIKVSSDLNATSSNLEIRNVDFGGDLNASDSSLKLENCDVIGFVQVNRGDLGLFNSDVHQSVTVNQGSLRMTKCTVDQDLSVNHPSNQANADTRAVVLQSTITEKLTCKAKRSWICYNTIRHAVLEGTTEITGNHFDGRTLNGIGIDLNGAHTTANVFNNRIHDYRGSKSSNIGNTFIGIRVRGQAGADIVNNLIYDCYDSHHEGTENKGGMGIFIQSTAPCKILGNALWNCFVRSGTGSNPGNKLIWAPAFGVLVQNNQFWKKNSYQGTIHVGGGVFAKDSIEGDPKFVNPSSNFTLQATSPAINAGPPDPQYNDRDGTRNDIGMYGGHSFIPNGKTTNKPIVLSLDVAPIFVPVGGKVTIESTGATVK